MTPAERVAETDRGAAEAVLARTRALVAPCLQDVLTRVAPELRASLGEHLGSGGKFVRAALVLVADRACGGEERDALDGAVAIELVHNFSLVHDDLIDGDVERRHHPTLWSLHGQDHAVIAGDALATLAFQVLLDAPTARRAAAAALLAEGTQAMIAGQALDLALEHERHATLEQCLAMVEGKTAALLRCATSMGAVLAGAPDDAVAALGDYGRDLGIAFQAVDDLLGVWGEAAVTGKPVGNDLRRRKKTIPVSLALRDGVELPELLLGDPDAPLGDREVEGLRDRLEAAGARAATEALGQHHLEAALSALGRVALEPRATDELVALAHYVVERQR